MKKILLCLMVLALIACGQDDKKIDNKVAVNKKVENPAKKRKGTLNLAITGKFEGKFNPAISTTHYDTRVNAYIFETLLSYGNDFKFKPGTLVENYKYNKEKIQYIFHIKKGVKFQDGVELTSEDVKFTYSLYARPEYSGMKAFASASIKGFQDVADGKVRYIKGIETPDKYTVIFNMTEANARSLNNFVARILPKHYYEYAKSEDYKTEFLTKNEKPLGSGAYKLTEYKPGEYVVLDRFKDYHEGSSEVKKIVIKYIPGDSVSPALAKGELDVAEIGGRKSKEKEIASSNNLVNFQKTPPGGYSYIGFNLRKEKFQDKTLRQALTYGLNRELYATKVLEGYAKVVNQPLVPQHWASSKNVNDYAYNPEKAKKMLEDDGWKLENDGFRYKNGEKLAFSLKTSASSGQTSTGKTFIALIKQNWKQIGVDVDIQLVDFNAIVKDIQSEGPKFDTVMLAWSTIPDPDQSNLFKTGGGSNFVGYSNKKVDELCVEGLAELAIDGRTVIYDEMMKEINNDLPYIFLTSRAEVIGINKRISGLDYMNGIDPYEATRTDTLKLEN